MNSVTSELMAVTVPFAVAATPFRITAEAEQEKVARAPTPTRSCPPWRAQSRARRTRPRRPAGLPELGARNPASTRGGAAWSVHGAVGAAARHLRVTIARRTGTVATAMAA